MATHLTFIVLNSAIKSRIVCDLTEKIFLENEKLVIYARQEAECQKLDSLLWTWKQQSFIPHACAEILTEMLPEPVVLTSRIEKPAGYTALLLVDPLPVEIVSQFPKVIDFAEKYDAESLVLSRKRYKEYRDGNFSIETLQPGEYLHNDNQ